jgi:hypothetical protein
MARPHSTVLFSLSPVPGNEQAKNAIAHPANSHLVSTSPSGVLVLDIGFDIHRSSHKTLATLGRGLQADIHVEGGNISRLQCSFELDLDSGVVMFYDRSHGCTSQVFGQNAIPFERGRTRKVLVQRDLNTIIGMGGERHNLVQFNLDWHQNPIQAAEIIGKYGALPCGRLENPRTARTTDGTPTDLPSRRETGLLEVRYVEVSKLGSGQFGEVYKIIDVVRGG